MYDRPKQLDQGPIISQTPEGGPLYRWYMLGILLLIYIFGAVDRSVVSVVTEPLKREFHLTDADVGALGGIAYSITFSIFVLPMGWLIDRVNRRTLLSLTVAIWSVLTMCGGSASTFLQLILARMGVGATESAASPGSLSLITDIFPIHERNTAVGIYYAGAPAGQLVIFVIGGWLLMHFEWRIVFLVAGIPGLVLAALLFFTCREPVRGAQERSNPSGHRAVPKLEETVRLIVLDPALRSAMIANMVSTGVQSTLVLWLTSFLVRLYAVPIIRAAIWVGVGYGLSQTLASLVIGPVADRYSKGDPARLARIPACMTFLGIFGGTMMALAPTLPIALAGLVCLSILGGFCNGPGYGLVLSLAKPEIRGSTMAAAKLIGILVGSGVFPLMTGAISDAVGGSESIRPAILATVWLLGISSWFFALAGRQAGGRIPQRLLS